MENARKEVLPKLIHQSLSFCSKGMLSFVLHFQGLGNVSENLSFDATLEHLRRFIEIVCI